MATEENTYFLRSFLLLVEGGLYISRETLGRECQKAGGNLDTLLKQCENKLKHEFHGKQYDKLFPQYGTTDINKWDLQLSVGVLINVFGRSLSLTEKQKLRALRDLRNEIYMHCASASLDQKKYEEVQEELEDIITTLAATFDKTVRDRCSAYITQFATGPLDGVKPSLATLNGFSQTCQKKLKVGLHTELVVGGPSDYWINLCEHTLDTILNNAESMASEGAGFEEIEKNVKKMLDFLLANKNVVFKGSKKACIILMFECNSYDDALLFLQTLDSQEFRDHLSRISDALLRHYQFDATISISASVRTECLQSILIDILKMSSSEEVAHRHLEISSENDDHAKLMQGTEEEFSQKAENKHPLRLDLECTSKNGLLHFLKSFKDDYFSGHLKSVADALSKHFGTNITLKASLDVDDVMAAIEEAVSRDSTRCMVLQHNSKAIDLHEDKSEFDFSSDFVSDETVQKRVCLVKLYAWIKEEMSTEAAKSIANHLYESELLSSSDLESIVLCYRRMDTVEQLLTKVLMGPCDIHDEFIKALKEREEKYIAYRLDSETVSDTEIEEFLKLEWSSLGQCMRPDSHEPRLKFTGSDHQTLLDDLSKDDINNINDHLMSRFIFSIREHTDIVLCSMSRQTRVQLLIDTMEKCAEKIFKTFCEILNSIGLSDVIGKLEKSRQKGKFSPTQDSESEPPANRQNVSSSIALDLSTSGQRPSSTESLEVINQLRDICDDSNINIGEMLEGCTITIETIEKG